MPSKIITQDELVRLLDYNPETGEFVRKVRRCGRALAGAIAGTTPNSEGYLSIKINNRRYKMHRLAWLFVHGAWPTGEIDHINGIKNDNRIKNLRDVTRSQNMQNKRMVKGYSRQKSGWYARIACGKKQHHLGVFSTESDARAAYLAAKKFYHPTAPTP